MRLIDADALFPYGAVPYIADDGFETADKIYGIIKNAPTIEARPVVRGEWIDGFFKDTVECSVCFEKGVCKCYETRHNFCPNCGADMRGAVMEDEKNEAVSEA